jgi:hydroxymethylpyrimidine/phosphomethylpyrimidine kinase
MDADRPYVISIAGFDPTGGAGVLADVKCFEQHGVYGFGVCSALTVQSDTSFYKTNWIDVNGIIEQLKPLLDKFDVRAAKIGLVRDLDVLAEVVDYLKQHSSMQLVVDPVMKASAGYTFHDWSDALLRFQPVLERLDLLTPNAEEMRSLGGSELVNDSVDVLAMEWAKYCPVLLKGGHMESEKGTDCLFIEKDRFKFKPAAQSVYQKHGSGCVLSASITANLGLGHKLPIACQKAKTYIETFLNSNHGLLGYHRLDSRSKS